MSRITKAAAVALGAGAVVVSGSGLALADADAHGAAVNSPGVVSGNVIQVPIDIPINVCGNTIDIVGLLNPAFGNTCANVSKEVKPGHHDNGGYGDNGYGR
ncbi:MULTISPECIES: chaplin [unclassified Streptomyces]|uniref:chaplin n=1 Tax=unclassified Streptomyces TaxID=2593676 RepID=UPI003401BB4C